MYNYDVDSLRQLFEKILAKDVSADVFIWLKQKGNFNTQFVLVPRKTGKAALHISEEEDRQLDEIIPGFTLNGWSIDMLGRAYLLLELDETDTEAYFRKIENLFSAAEVNELVALYSALPLLAHPERWVKRCAEGIRSNIGNVLEAIMYQNPYPQNNLDQSAWNQLILKAFFTGKDVGKIQGIDTRANKELAYVVRDYVHERRAAGRDINPSLWRLVGPFIDDKVFEDVKWAMESGVYVNQKAAALALSQSNYQPAVELLNSEPRLKAAIEQKELTWDSLTIEHQH
ncbi:EboA domain-containing protein [Mucilaginibacter calamicampi]|uniref:EboA domain-containing protein n=1 Tax=Mucilaginibacter calamicampi TaxID=1302352 RepID=A0ABW2Z419_9SPHI